MGLGSKVPFGCGPHPFLLQGNLFGARALGGTMAGHPREVTVGFNSVLTHELGLRMGAGIGLGDGYGTPSYRMFAGLNWTASSGAASRSGTP